MNPLDFLRPLIFIFCAIFSSYLITYFSIPKIIKFGKNYNFIDYPNLRKQHITPLVRIGGVSIALGFISVSIFLLSINMIFNLGENSGGLKYLGLIISFFLFFLIGLYDDVLNVKPLFRLFLQFLLSAFIWIFGFRIDILDLSFLRINIDYLNLSSGLSFLITCIWITGIVNALNWFDGLDGLAVGITSVIASSLFFICLLNNEIQLSILLSSVVASCMAFYSYNRYPAKILMGDCGSYLLGSVLSIISILGAQGISNINAEAISIQIPFLLLGILILDMGYVITIRLINSNSPFFPDRNHLHHRLLNQGLNQSQVVRIIILFFIFISILTTLYAININSNSILYRVFEN